MRFRLDQLTGSTLEQAAKHYERHGFFVVDGVADVITHHFKSLVAERIMVDEEELERMLEPDNPPLVLSQEVRQRLSRIMSPPELQTVLLATLGAVFQRLIGPFVHVSSTFHGQFKGGDAPTVSKGGYDPNARYLEVQGQYLLHQDFAGASIPTSPAGVTLWTPLNSCDDWNLRMYPGSHRLGLLCEEWMKLDDPRLSRLGPPVDVKAEFGSAIIFNALLLHASSNPGMRRRVSCDIRFFPLCGFLPSPVHVLGGDALGTFRSGLQRHDDATLRAPYLEAAAFMGLMREPVLCEPHSVLNWANVVRSAIDGDRSSALAHLRRFTNLEVGIDAVDAYAPKFLGAPIHRETLEQVLERVKQLEPAAAETAALQRVCSTAATTP